MNLIGERVKVVGSTDPSVTGRSGIVVLETANTLLIDQGRKTLRVQKKGTSLQISKGGRVVTGSDVSGRLEDRWGKGKS